MFDFFFRFLLAVFACVGLVHTVAWMIVRHSSRGCKVIRVFPVGETVPTPAQQMSAMYACLQWEANPSQQKILLYDVGLDAQGVQDCEKLAQGAGVDFVPKETLSQYIDHFCT